MIDIHAHILPFLDDGAGSYGEAVAMCHRAARDGVTAVVATPHMCDDLFDVQPQQVFAALETLRGLCRWAEIPLTLLPGGDVHFSPDLKEKLQSREVLTIADAGSHLLVELPQQVTSSLVDAFIEQLSECAATPVISHPERNFSVMRRPGLLASFVEAGCLVQITAGSFLGAFGRTAKLLAWKLISLGLVHVVASDAHSMSWRPPLLGECADEIRRRCGEDLVQELFYANPAKIIKGAEVSAPSATSAVRAHSIA